LKISSTTNLVTLGTIAIAIASEGSIEVEATEAIAHEGFNKDTNQNDIGLLKLPDPITTNSMIRK